MAAQQEVIKNFLMSLDETTQSGVKALNEAVAKLTTNAVTTIQAVINQMVADCKAAANADTFLEEYCGIILDNTDTGAITGKDAGGASILDPISVVSESGTLKSFASGTFTAGGAKFELATSNASISAADQYNLLSDVQRYIWNGLGTWWAKESLNLITASYGANYGLATNALGNTNTIKVYFQNANNNTLASAGYLYNKAGTYAGVGYPNKLTVNTKYYNGVPATLADMQNGKSTLSGAGFLDRTLAHEFTHSVMQNNIKYFYALPQFITEGMAELTHGIDDERAYTITKLAGNYKSLNSALNVKNTSTGSEPAYAGGYMFLRYMAKELQTPSYSNGNDKYSNYNNSSVVNALAGNDTIRNLVQSATIDGGAGADYLTNTKTLVSLFGGADNDIIESKVAKSNSTLNGGAGNDSIVASNYTTIIAGAGADTLTGAGYNTYMFGNADGANIITKIVPKTDVVYFSDATSADDIIAKHSTIGNDMIMTSGSTTVTLQNMGNQSVKIRYFDSATDKLVTKAVKSPIFTQDNDYYSTSKAGTYSALAGNDTITSSANKAKMVGGDGNDSLIAMAGTITNTLQGGAGNDTLIADSKSYLQGNADNDYISITGGANTIVYSAKDGSDTIKGWQGTDLLQISGVKNVTQIATTTVGKDLQLAFGESSVRIVNPGTVRAKIGNKIYVLQGITAGTATADYLINSVAGSAKTWSMLAGNDSVYSYLADTKTDGGADNDYIYNYKNAINNTLLGGAGDDSIYTQAPTVSMSGDADNDYLNSTAASVTITGGAGNDTIALNGAAKFNVINYAAGDGADIITGFNADDTLNITGGYYTTLKSGKDLIVKVGADTKASDNFITIKNYSKGNIAGTEFAGTMPSGFDMGTLSLNAKTTIAAIGASAGGNIDMGYYPTARGFTPQTNTLSAAVTVKGNWQNNLIQGGNGNDSLNGFMGSNTLIGGAGNDVLLGAAGVDTLSGGDGNDTLYGNAGNDKIWGSAGNDYMTGEAGNDYLVGEDGDDIAYGGAGNDTLYGGAGVDKLYGDEGNDKIYAGDGNDSVYGGAGNDYLYGEYGNDTLIGDAGNDQLYGGAGADVFVFGEGKDVVNDYTSEDKIYFGTHEYKYTASGNSAIFTDGTDSITIKNALLYGKFSYDSKTKTGTFKSASALMAEDDNFIGGTALLDEIIAEPITGDFETAQTSRDTVQSAITYSNDL